MSEHTTKELSPKGATMTPQEVLTVLDNEIASLPAMAAMSVYKCDPADAIEKLTRARAAVSHLIDGHTLLETKCSELASYNELLTQRCIEDTDALGKAERDALRRRVEELERKLERDVQAAHDKYTRPQGMTRS